MAEISVIVPVYNAGEFLEACIESVTSQIFTDWELLLIDDGSTDDSNHICRNYALADNRIKLIEQPNGGVSSARNAGLDSASGRYVAFLDADDEFYPDALSVLYGIAVSHKSDITIGKWKRAVRKSHENVGGSADDAVASGKVRTLGPVQFCADMLYRKSYADSTVCGRLFSLRLFDGIRFYNGKYEDLEILPRLILRSNMIAVTDRLIYFYRDNPSSFINTWADNRRDAVSVTRKIMDEFKSDKELSAAALNRHFRANYNLLLGLLRHCPDDEEAIKECYEEIRHLRRQVITDSRSRLSTLAGAIVSYMGVRGIKLLTVDLHK